VDSEFNLYSQKEIKKTLLHSM